MNMAWKYRSLQPLLLALGAAFVANCGSTVPPQPACADGTTDCQTSGASAGGASSGAGNSSNTTGSGGIPVIDTGSATGTGGIPVIDSSSASSTTNGTGGSGTVTTGTDGTVTTGANNSGTTDGTNTTGTGGTSGGGTVLATIRVSAGQFERDHTIVKFPFPEGADYAKRMALFDSEGNQVAALQYSSATGNASFILETMAAGASADYTVQVLAQDLPAGVTYTNDTHLFYKIGDSTVFRWTMQIDNFRGAAQNNERVGYVYPLYTPAGLNVADDYQEDHPHMHGVWSAWTNTTFRNHHVDFWNGYANEGRVDQAASNGIAGVWDGPVHAGLISNLEHIDFTTGSDVVVLTEQWIVTIFKTHADAQPYYVFDIESVQKAATADPLILEQYHYGGFGFRGAQEWTNTANVSYLTDQGYNRTAADGQKGKWVAQYGQINGQTGGYAGLGHPDNFRASPDGQGLRIHPTNPYWAFVPCTALAGGRFELPLPETSGGPDYHSKFRVISFDGNADAAFLDREWNDYATPPTVERL